VTLRKKGADKNVHGMNEDRKKRVNPNPKKEGNCLLREMVHTNSMRNPNWREGGGERKKKGNVKPRSDVAKLTTVRDRKQQTVEVQQCCVTQTSEKSGYGAILRYGIEGYSRGTRIGGSLSSVGRRTGKAVLQDRISQMGEMKMLREKKEKKQRDAHCNGCLHALLSQSAC